MPLIKFKGIKVLKKKDNVIKIVNISKLNIKYEHFIFAMKVQDNLKNGNINASYRKQNTLLGNNYLKIEEDKYSIMKLYTNKESKNNKYYKLIKYRGKNIVEESFNDIESRKLSNKLLLPHYFFTGRYNEKSMPSQSRSWSNSVYNFLKIEKSGIKYLDIYTNKLIKLFFNIKYIQRKKIWDTILLSGLKIKSNLSIIKDMNIMIKYTSTRSSWFFKNLNYYPSIILTFTWLLEQIKFSSYMRKIITGRKEGIISGFKIKKKNYIRKLDKVFISKPLFKHTSFNLIIDLFVYNNKTNKLQKFENMLSRRVLYKYMYSLYIDYSKKVKETLNRPRFFYLNLIEPKTFNYYSNIIKLYEKILTISSKGNFFYLCLLLLKWNFIYKNNIQYLKNKYLFFKHKGVNKVNNVVNRHINNFSWSKDTLSMYIDNVSSHKNYNLYVKGTEKRDINNINNNELSKITFKRRLLNGKKNLYYNNIYYILGKKYIGLKKKNFKYNNVYNINKNIFEYEKEEYNKEDNKSNKKNNKEKKSRYLKYKKYFQELERKSTTPIDLNKLTLWSRKGLGRKIINNEDKKREKHFRHNKYSLEQFKRKIYYAKGKIKRKVAPKIWQQKLMSFFLFSRAQKRDSNSSRKFFNLNNKIIINDFKNNVNKKKTILDKDNIKHRNYYKGNKKEYKIKYFNNFNNQGIIKKEQRDAFNIEKKDLKAVITNKEKFLNKEKNLEFLLLNESLISKEQSLDNVNYSSYNNNNILNELFDKFFILKNKKDININFLYNKKFILSKLNPIDKFKNNKDNYNLLLKKNSNKMNLDLLKIKHININSVNNKIIWNNLDYSIILLLNKIFEFSNNKKYWLKLFSYEALFNKIKNIINNNNIWYIHLIKKEFYIVNRDVLLSKVLDILPNDNNNILFNNYKYDNNTYNNIILEFKSDINILDINIWSSNIRNKRDNNLKNKIGYSEEIFKPYYRYMIPLFIYKSYKSFMFYLGYKNSFMNFKSLLYSKFNWIYTNNLIVLNFIIVKTLLDLLHYNYRSLIRVKPKYYYLNKLRYFGTKAKRLNFNTWIASVKYIKRLRKTPRHFWLRYHKLISFYYGRIIQNAELDTKRKVLLPFVFYFEDLLFNIYGKWAIIRLWPLKRYYLNSFILAERIMLVILAQGSSTSSILEYRQSARNLINILRWSQVKKTYNYYNENKSRWPASLINNMKESNSSHYLNYNNLEYFNSKLEKAHVLSTYPLFKARLNNYLPSGKSHYIYAFRDNFKTIKNWSTKKKLIYNKGKISSSRYVYYWLRPLNSYLIQMKNHLDISGIKFKLTGRPGIIKSNVRSFSKTYFYGNLLGARHFNSKTLKTSSLSNPLLRGTIKSNIDYNYYTSKSNNGSITLKIWMSSLFTSDVHELLLYLLRIKNLYLELINRYYLVYSKFANLKNYYLFNKVTKPIWIGKKRFLRKNFKNFKNKINQKRDISYIYQYKLKKNIKNRYYYVKGNYTNI